MVSARCDPGRELSPRVHQGDPPWAPHGKTLVFLAFLEGRLCYTTVDSVGASVEGAKSYG